MRWILLDHEIDDSASEREGEGRDSRDGAVGDKRKALMKQGDAPQDVTKSGLYLSDKSMRGIYLKTQHAFHYL